MKAKTICGFKVTVERQKVWQIELEMLKLVDKICQKHNLHYSLVGGSLLGAVRHKGFIPWDDDIDLAMKRKDYEKFLKIAQKELPKQYFVQYCETEPLYDRGHAQIRNSETTAIINTDIVNSAAYNKGIWIDIFPLDAIPDNPLLRKIFVHRAITKKVLLRGPTTSKPKLAYQKIFGKQRLINRFHKFVQKYDGKKTKQCGALEFRPNEFKYDSAWFDSYVELPFENMKAKALAGYKELLERQYGDYMAIPKNKNGTVHGGAFFDTGKSYKEYEAQRIEICKKMEEK